MQFTLRSFFSPFLSTVNLQTLLQFFSYDSEMYEAILYPILYPSTFLFCFFRFLHGQVRENPSTPLERTP